MEYSPEYQERLRELNQLIAERIRIILNNRLKGHDNGTYGHIDDPDKDIPLQMVQLGVAHDEDDLEDMASGFGYMPILPELHFPIYVFQGWGDEMIQRVTTPYGVLNRVVIGLDNSFYSFTNTYFFNQEGEALKLEAVYKESMENETLEYRIKTALGVTPNQIARVDFTPKPEETRYVKLETGDYEKIDGIIGQIESGVLSLVM